MEIRFLAIRKTLWALALALLAVGLTAGGLVAQSKKPDFSGQWEIDKEKSTRPDVVSETIDHKEPKVVITSTPTNGDSFTIRLTTDGKEILNIVGGREMTAQTRWEGDKLVTLVRDPKGMQFSEVRSLSEDGRVQTIEGFMDPGRKQAMFRRVMVKR
jgi:hypothetical protein